MSPTRLRAAVGAEVIFMLLLGAVWSHGLWKFRRCRCLNESVHRYAAMHQQQNFNMESLCCIRCSCIVNVRDVTTTAELRGCEQRLGP